MTSRYKDILEITNKFPFLKDVVTENVREIYSDAELLDFRKLAKDYDYETDLFKISSHPLSYARSRYYYYRSIENENIPFTDNKDKLLFNLLNDEHTKELYENNFTVLIDMCNTLIDSLKIKKEDLKSSYSLYVDYDYCVNVGENTLVKDDIKMLYKVCAVSYLIGEHAFNSSFRRYINSVTSDGKLQFIEDINNGAPAVKHLHKLCKFLLTTSDDVVSSSSYKNTAKRDAGNLLDSIVKKVYDSYPLEDIETFKTNAAKVSEIFKYLDVEYCRDQSLLNSNISDEDRARLTKNFTSANDIKLFVKDVITSFKSIETFDGDKVVSIINGIIINNKKIRDRDFPVTKDKVIHEFIRNMFVSNEDIQSIRSYKEYDKEFEKIVDACTSYFVDPYFITSLLIKDSVVTRRSITSVKNTRRLVKDIFSNKKACMRFIDNYLKVLNTPETERVSTVKGFDKSEISYGILYYIMKQYIEDNVKIEYSGREEDGSISIEKLILFAYDKYKDTFKKTLLGSSGCKSISDSYSYYYYGSNNAHEKIVQGIENTLAGFRDYGDIRVAAHDGSSNVISMLEQIKRSSMTRIMTYIKGTDDEFVYNEDRSFGVDQLSRWGWSDEGKTKVDRSALYDYSKNAIRIILLEIYGHIIEDYPTLTEEEKTKIREFITKNNTDTKITILPDTSHCRKTNNKNHPLSKDYSSDVTKYECLNYISLPVLMMYMMVYRHNIKYGNLYTMDLYEDMVLIPETSYNCRNTRTNSMSDLSKIALDNLNKLTKEELQFLKPVLYDNFSDTFKFDRTIQICMFAGMLLELDGFTSYKQNLFNTFFENGTPEPKAPRAIDYIQEFYVAKMYPKMLSENLLTQEQIDEVQSFFNKAYIDFDCMVSLR